VYFSISSRFALNLVPGFHSGYRSPWATITNLEEELQILDGSRQIPVGFPLVGDLVIVIRRIFLALLLAEALRLAAVLDA
jgi:hypothetical protein